VRVGVGRADASVWVGRAQENGDMSICVEGVPSGPTHFIIVDHFKKIFGNSINK
jgi:hypothetical protein